MKPIPAAAAELGVSERELRRWLRAGAPQARRGRRGRGGAALLDVHAVRAWRRQATAQDVLVALAGEIPELVAETCDAVFVNSDGPHKRALAGSLVATWYCVTLSLLDRIRRVCPEVGEIGATPEKIIGLRHIWERSRSLDSRPTDTPAFLED